MADTVIRGKNRILLWTSTAGSQESQGLSQEIQPVTGNRHLQRESQKALLNPPRQELA